MNFDTDQFGNVIGCRCPDTGCGCDWPETVSIVVSKRLAEELAYADKPLTHMESLEELFRAAELALEES